MLWTIFLFLLIAWALGIVSGYTPNKLNQFAVGIVFLGFLGSGVFVGCEKGPAEKVGEKLDKAMDQLTGKGPIEKAGERIDDAVDELKKK